MHCSSIGVKLLSILVLLAGITDSAAQDGSIAVRIDMIDGNSKSGTLAGVSSGGIRLLGDDSNPQEIALEQILSIQRTAVPPTTPSGPRVGLVGGSRLAITGVKSDGTSATLQVRGGGQIVAPLKSLRWVRFRNPAAAVDPQWLGLIDRQRASDSLVIRRPGDTIDEVAGIVLAITDESVSFNLDGDTMQAPIARLEGIVFTTTGASATSQGAGVKGPIMIDDTFGSRFIATSIVGSDDRGIELQLGEELKYRLPLDSIAKIELTGSVEFLATIEPAEANYVPLINIGISPQLARLWLNPEVRDGRDLVMRSRSHVEYRLPEGFQTLVGSVDFDPEVTAGGRCVVKISLDGKPVWEQSLEVTDASIRGFEIPVQGARRVRFEVGAGGDGDLGDTIRLRQPRITK